MNELNDLIGFVNGNSIRQKVLSLLSSKGEMEGKRVSKTLRVAHPTIAKTLDELEQKELITKKGRNVLPYRIWNKSGKKMIQQI
ncbi:transcriptional regulator [Methanosarcina barkeri]|uniref:transcriptional regulator n=1 Tax=Methanosarcina barkeri TaxID=2208 RepID=UPI000B2DE9E7|nr:transcriptional regulator [Methanosarcina barkeri]